MPSLVAAVARVKADNPLFGSSLIENVRFFVVVAHGVVLILAIFGVSVL